MMIVDGCEFINDLLLARSIVRRARVRPSDTDTDTDDDDDG